MKNKLNSIHTAVMQRSMTVKEVAQALRMSYDTIMQKARELGYTQNGITTHLNEKQVTEIKKLLVPRTFELKSKVDSTVTAQEENETILQAITILKHRSNEYKKRAESAEKRLIEQQPKADFYDAVAESKDAIDIGKVAKVLNVGIGRNRLFETLRNKHILQNTNVPYQKYIDAGYFRVIEQKYMNIDGTTHINVKTLVYQRGVDFIRKICIANNVITN